MGWMLRTGKAGFWGFAILLAISLAMSAQESSSAASTSALGDPQDWSNRHVIYTGNGSIAQMMLLREDPRFIHSLYRRYSQEHRKEIAAAVGLNLAKSVQDRLEDADWDVGLNDIGANENQLDRGFQPFIIWDPMRPICGPRTSAPKSTGPSLSVRPAALRTAKLRLSTPPVIPHLVARPTLPSTPLMPLQV